MTRRKNTNLKNQKRHGKVETWRGSEEKLEHKLIPLSLGSQPLLISLTTTILLLKL